MTILVATGAIFFANIPPISAEEIPGEPTGHEIAINVDEREDGDDQISEATWTLTNKAGKTRKRHTLRYWKDYEGKDGLSSKSFIYFEFPPDVKDTTLNCIFGHPIGPSARCSAGPIL